MRTINPTEEKTLDVAREFWICRTKHWLINHRVDTALPGYLMVSPMKPAKHLSDMGGDTLASLGPVLAMAEDTLRQVLEPKRVYVGRYGHAPGYPVHFHLIPIFDWLEDLFWCDQRYRSLQTFGSASTQHETDGAELTFFVWREFCEAVKPPQTQGPPVSEAIVLLTQAFDQSSKD